MIDNKIEKKERTPTPKKLLDGFAITLQEISEFMERVKAKDEARVLRSKQQTLSLEWLGTEVANSGEIMQKLHDLSENSVIDPQYLRKSATDLERLESVFKRAKNFFHEGDDEPPPGPNAA